MANILTKAMEKMTKLMVDTNTKMGKMGEMPYGQRKATTEERKMQRAIAEEMEIQELLNG